MIPEEFERSRVYEVGVQMVPTLGDEGAAQNFTRLKDRVTELGGSLIQEGAPERIDLAYPMYQVRENKKTSYNEAYFAWYKFEIDASLIKGIEQELAQDLSIIRYLAFKTVRENTYTARKNPRRRAESRSSGEEQSAEELPPVIVDPVVEDEVEVEVPSLLDKPLDELTASDVV